MHLLIVPVRSMACAVALSLLLFAAPSRAALLTVGGATIGSISTQGPNVAGDAFSGGVNFWANWSLDVGQTKVNAADLRWLQLSSFSKVVSGFPNPNRPFIDPRTGQSLDGSVAGDSLPWYDVTGPTKATLSVTGGGDDPWMGDGPSAPYGLAPLTFSVDTLVVDIVDAANKQARILGGVSWGYSISTAGGNSTTAIGVADLSNTALLRDAANTALAIDFPGWTLVVPEPSAALLFVLGAALLALHRRRNRV